MDYDRHRVLFAREFAFDDFSLPIFQIRVYARSFAAKWFLFVARLRCDLCGKNGFGWALLRTLAQNRQTGLVF